MAPYSLAADQIATHAASTHDVETATFALILPGGNILDHGR
jgi:hypothetical protein